MITYTQPANEQQTHTTTTHPTTKKKNSFSPLPPKKNLSRIFLLLWKIKQIIKKTSHHKNKRKIIKRLIVKKSVRFCGLESWWSICVCLQGLKKWLCFFLFYVFFFLPMLNTSASSFQASLPILSHPFAGFGRGREGGGSVRSSTNTHNTTNSTKNKRTHPNNKKQIHH